MIEAQNKTVSIAASEAETLIIKLTAALGQLEALKEFAVHDKVLARRTDGAVNLVLEVMRVIDPRNH